LTQNLSFILTRRGTLLSGYVNSQNNRYWSTENPHAVHEVPQHDLKVGVWRAIGARRTVEPVSFHETVNSDRYVRLILSPLFGQLTDEKSYGHFMQDNATAHTANNSVVALHEAFGERVRS
jgi:hypothetical protein